MHMVDPKSTFSLYHCFLFSSSCLSISFPFHNRPFLSFISIFPEIVQALQVLTYNLYDYHQGHAS